MEALLKLFYYFLVNCLPQRKLICLMKKKDFFRTIKNDIIWWNEEQTDLCYFITKDWNDKMSIHTLKAFQKSVPCSLPQVCKQFRTIFQTFKQFGKKSAFVVKNSIFTHRNSITAALASF